MVVVAVAVVAAAARRCCRVFADRAGVRGKEAPSFVSHAGRALESKGGLHIVYAGELRWGVHVASS